jgi:LPS-assembly protein
VENKYVTYDSFKIGYNNMPYNVYLVHIYQKKVSEALTLGASYNTNVYKKIYTEYSYDLVNNYTKYWLLGMKQNKKCWDYDISFKRSRIPVLEEEGVSFREDNVISISVELKPIGGINQTFIFKGNR